jgi:hypothetical protein
MASLHHAAKIGNLNTVIQILNSGVNVNSRDPNGLTPLHTASYYRQLPVVRLLLNRGANINARNENGQTPLHSAMYEGHLPTVQLLLNRGANIKARTSIGNTPLHIARIFRHFPIIRLLLNRGAIKNSLPISLKYKYAKKWILGPAKNVNVSVANLNAPVNLSFNKGNYGIRYTKRWMANGVNKSKSHYYTIPTFERLVGKRWSTIRHNKPTSLISNHLPHAKQIPGRVYRRNLNLVKFV